MVEGERSDFNLIPFVLAGSNQRCVVIENKVRAPEAGNSSTGPGINRGQQSQGRATSGSIKDISSQLNNSTTATTAQRGKRSSSLLS